MSYFITHSGERVDVDTITANQIHIEDIAHHLSNISRYNGALDFDKYYSVAQHSINVALYVYEITSNIEMARYALLHDASEAYLGDIISGVKSHLPDYKKLELKLENIILKKFNISPITRVLGHDTIKAVDQCILLDESKTLFPEYYDAFTLQYPDLEPLGITINPHHSKKEVYDKFISLCKIFRVINVNKTRCTQAWR